MRLCLNKNNLLSELYRKCPAASWHSKTPIGLISEACRPVMPFINCSVLLSWQEAEMSRWISAVWWVNVYPIFATINHGPQKASLLVLIQFWRIDMKVNYEVYCDIAFVLCKLLSIGCSQLAGTFSLLLDLHSFLRKPCTIQQFDGFEWLGLC